MFKSEEASFDLAFEHMACKNSHDCAVSIQTLIQRKER